MCHHLHCILLVSVVSLTVNFSRTGIQIRLESPVNLLTTLIHRTFLKRFKVNCYPFKLKTIPSLILSQCLLTSQSLEIFVGDSFQTDYSDWTCELFWDREERCSELAALYIAVSYVALDSRSQTFVSFWFWFLKLYSYWEIPTGFEKNTTHWGWQIHSGKLTLEVGQVPHMNIYKYRNCSDQISRSLSSFRRNFKFNVCCRLVSVWVLFNRFRVRVKPDQHQLVCCIHFGQP